MTNVLGTDKQIEIIGALCEGSSIRSIERTTSVHRDTMNNPRRHITVLHVHPMKSAQDAVRAVIVQEFRNESPEEA